MAPESFAEARRNGLTHQPDEISPKPSSASSSSDGPAGPRPAENRLDRILPQLAYPRVLILDELGYLPLTRE